MTTNNSEQIKSLKQENQILIDLEVESLKDKIEMLIKDLSYQKKMLDKDGSDYGINALGIIQGRAWEIDNSCGRLGALKQTKDRLDNIK